MRFGTLQSIQQQPEREAEDTFDFELPKEPEELEDELQDEFDDVEDLGSGEQSIADKLMALRADIDDILSDMGYGDYADFDAESDFDAEDASQYEPTDFEFDMDADMEGDGNDFFDEPQLDGDEAAGDDEAPEGFGTTEEDPNFQGNIRTVAGADLVYKRKEEDGNYEELWIYNVGNDIKKETQIRRAILAGTDIVPSQRESEDGTQRSETFTVGNVQYLKIAGLPN